MIEKSRGVILATLAAGLLSSCASQAYNEQSAKGHCLGANACPGGTAPQPIISVAARTRARGRDFSTSAARFAKHRVVSLWSRP